MAKAVAVRDVVVPGGEGRSLKRVRSEEIDVASQEELFAVIAEAEEMKARAWARLMAPKAVAAREPDRSLSAREVAALIGMGKDWVYAHGEEIPGSWPTGKGIRRWSAAAVEAWKAREGKRRKANG